MLRALIGATLLLVTSVASAGDQCRSPFLYQGQPRSFYVDIAKHGALVYLINDYLNRIEVVLVSDPAVPVPVVEYEDYEGLGNMTSARLIWPHIYITDQARGLVVLDVSNPFGIHERGAVTMQWGASAVEVVGDYAYVAHGRDGLVQVSIEDPDNPFIVAHLTESDFNASTVSAHEGRLAAGSWGGAVRVFDISDPNSVEQLCDMQVGEHVTAVEISSKDLYVGSSATQSWSLDNPLSHYDLTDVSDPTLISSRVMFSDIVDIDVVAEQVVVTAEVEGLLLFDRLLEPLAQYSHSHPSDSVQTIVDEGIAYTALLSFQMAITDLEVSGAPTLRSVYSGSSCEQVLIEKVGDFLYAAGGVFDNVINVIDVSMKDAWQVVHQIDTITGDAHHLEIAGDLLLHTISSGFYSRLEIYSISVPSKPLLVSSLDLPNDPSQMVYADERVFLKIDQEQAIIIVDVSDPANPSIISQIDGRSQEFVVNGGRLYRLGLLGRIDQYDIADSTSPELLTTQYVEDASSIAMFGEQIVLSVPPAQFEPPEVFYYTEGVDGMLEQGRRIGPLSTHGHQQVGDFVIHPTSMLGRGVNVWKIPEQGVAILVASLSHSGSVHDLLVEGHELYVPVGGRILTYDLRSVCGFVCEADLNQDGLINFFDVSAFLVAYSEENPVADFDQNGSYNFFDVSHFLEEYFAGCP